MTDVLEQILLSNYPYHKTQKAQHLKHLVRGVQEHRIGYGTLNSQGSTGTDWK